MPNVATLLKNEISRLSKKAARQYVAPVQSITTTHRKQIAALTKQVQQLQRLVAQLQRAIDKNQARTEEPSGERQFRFSAKGLRSLRKRLDLSAEEFGRLIPVGAQTVYSWESEKTSPRPAQLPVIAGLRGIGKREIRARLDGLNGTQQ